MTLPTDERGRLSPEQRELFDLLSRRKKKKKVAEAPGPIPRRADPGAPAPLSYSQHRLWFFDQLAPDSSAYNIPLVFRLRGPLDRAALERSLDEIVRRHEVLRTTCSREAGRPVQIVTPALRVPLEVVDLRREPEPQREAEVARIVGEEARGPFDLECGPMLRTRLLAIGEDEHVLVLVTHHFVSDGWSLRVWVNELCTLYAAFREGTEPRLPDLPIQYADFACWQRDSARTAALRRDLAFWKERLRDAPEEVALPVDHPSPRRTVHPGASRPVVLSPELSDRLRELSRREGITLYTLLLAAFQALLHRLSGADRISVGAPVSTRTRLETEELIGNFANYLLLITDLSGDPPFEELLTRVRKVASEGFAHQELPPELLAEDLQVTGEAYRVPALQLLFVLREGTLEEALLLPEIAVKRFHVEPEAARVDLYLDLVDGREGIGGTITFRRDLFEPATVDRFADRLRLLLERAAVDPGRRISELLPDGDLLPVSAPDATAPIDEHLPEFQLPKDTLELRLRGIWERVLGRGPIGSDDDFFDLGGTSVLALSVYAEIQRSLGVTLPQDAIIRAPTIGQLGATLHEGGWTSPWNHLVPLQPSGNRPGLFLIHGLEGGALPYALLTRRLGGDRPVYALQTDEVQEDEGFEDLAHKYLPEIRAVQPDGPYHIGGHCTGGLVALELGHQLRAAGAAVGLMAQMDPLFIPGGIRGFLRLERAMARYRGFVERNSETWHGRILAKLIRRRRQRIRASYRDGSRAFGQFDLDTARMMEAHSRMRASYDLRPWPGRVHVYLSDSRIARRHDPVPLWKGLATGGLEVVKVPGRHISMLAEPNVRLLADKVRQALHEAEATSASAVSTGER